MAEMTKGKRGIILDNHLMIVCVLTRSAMVPDLSYRAFVSGPDLKGYKWGRDAVYVRRRFLWMFHDFWNLWTEKMVFPFHPPCYELLVRALTGADDDIETAAQQIDQDVLYKAISRKAPTRPGLLDVDYGAAAKGQKPAVA